MLCAALAPEEGRQVQAHNSFPVPPGQLVSSPAETLKCHQFPACVSHTNASLGFPHPGDSFREFDSLQPHKGTVRLQVRAQHCARNTRTGAPREEPAPTASNSGGRRGQTGLRCREQVHTLVWTQWPLRSLEFYLFLYSVNKVH